MFILIFYVFKASLIYWASFVLDRSVDFTADAFSLKTLHKSRHQKEKLHRKSKKCDTNYAWYF
jgi:hypothetical protein